MENTYEDVVSAAMSLPPQARAVLAEQLLASLESSQDDVDAAWRAEIERRVKEIEEGEVQLISGEQVMSELRAELKQ